MFWQIHLLAFWAALAQSIMTWLGDQRLSSLSPAWTSQHGGEPVAGDPPSYLWGTAFEQGT